MDDSNKLKKNFVIKNFIKENIKPKISETPNIIRKEAQNLNLKNNSNIYNNNQINNNFSSRNDNNIAKINGNLNKNNDTIKRIKANELSKF